MFIVERELNKYNDTATQIQFFLRLSKPWHILFSGQTSLYIGICFCKVIVHKNAISLWGSRNSWKQLGFGFPEMELICPTAELTFG